jgi:predicted secreted Zn-dependent protease
MSARPAFALFASGFLLGGCASNVGLLQLGTMPSGVTMDARIHYYDVSAASLNELRRGMSALGPRVQGRSFQAAAQTNFRWTYQYHRRGLNCELRRVRVQLRSTITFPRWNPTAEPDSSLLEWWQQFNAGLMEHERGHVMISVETAKDIIRELEGLSAVGCETVAARANVEGQRLLMRNQQSQEEYDRTTRHGATQIERARRLRST